MGTKAQRGEGTSLGAGGIASGVGAGVSPEPFQHEDPDEHCILWFLPALLEEDMTF